jgi:hypothetical protein
MHLHAFASNGMGPVDSVSWMYLPLKTPPKDEELMSESINMLRRYNIVKAIASGGLERVRKWKQAAPEVVIPALFTTLTTLDVDTLRSYFQSGRIRVLGEVVAQYAGLPPNDPQFEKFFSVAESLQIPLGWHMGLGPPGVQQPGRKYRISLSSALLLEEVLTRHPRLRIYVMHAGWPLLDDMVAVLYLYQQVYVDVSVINWFVPRNEFHAYLKRLMDAGFGKRIMFGSDQMVWPEAIRLAIEGIESASFLTAAQKRDIFYNNAAKFLRLSQEEIRRDHGQATR